MPKSKKADSTRNTESENKVVETEERVENNQKNESKDFRDMGDVVAKDSTAKDGVKQTP